MTVDYLVFDFVFYLVVILLKILFGQIKSETKININMLLVWHSVKEQHSALDPWIVEKYSVKLDQLHTTTKTTTSGRGVIQGANRVNMGNHSASIDEHTHTHTPDGDDVT